MFAQFVGNLYGAVKIGHLFVISGKTIDQKNHNKLPYSFVIELKDNNKKDDATVPFHMSVRLSEDIIIRNSFGKDDFGGDYLSQLLTLSNPIVAGEKFQIYILINDDGFNISINGKPFRTFKFKLYLDKIKAISVWGDLETIIQIDHRTLFPAPFPYLQIDEPIEFSTDVPRKYLPGHIILIKATPFGNANGAFIIYFYEGTHKKQALHFKAKFGTDNVITRNTMNDDLLTYGHEERDNFFPFVINEPFQLSITLLQKQFKFAVNGETIATYNYRTKNQLDILNGLKINATNGLHMKVTSVNHFWNESINGDGFELNSNTVS